MTDMQQEILTRLKALEPQIFELRDDSHLHIGHAGNTGGGHYTLILASTLFQGQTRLDRQRMVQELLADLFANKQIHALSIRAYTPEEYFHK